MKRDIGNLPSGDDSGQVRLDYPHAFALSNGWERSATPIPARHRPTSFHFDHPGSAGQWLLRSFDASGSRIADRLTNSGQSTAQRSVADPLTDDLDRRYSVDREEISPVSLLIATRGAIIRNGLRHELKSQRGLAVVGEAESIDQAIEASLAFKPRVVVAELDPPEDGALVLCRWLAAVLPSVAVLVISRFHRDVCLAEAWKARAAGYLLDSDPISARVTAIRRAVDGQAFTPDRIRRILGWRRSLGECLDLLSSREGQTLWLLVEGKSIHEVSKMLTLAECTAKKHIGSLYRKFGIHSRSDLLVYVLKYHLRTLTDWESDSGKPLPRCGPVPQRRRLPFRSSLGLVVITSQGESQVVGLHSQCSTRGDSRADYRANHSMGGEVTRKKSFEAKPESCGSRRRLHGSAGPVVRRRPGVW